MAKTKPGSTLTDIQEKFCQEYLKDLNGTQAAIRAGYSQKSAHTEASRTLKIVKVHQRVQELMEARAKSTAITAEYVLKTIRDTVERCKQAEPVLDDEGEPTGEYKFEHSGVLKGAELLGKHLRLFTEKHEHSGPDGKAIEVRNLTDEQLDAQINALLEKTGRK